jgi:hypothetical protein
MITASTSGPITFSMASTSIWNSPHGHDDLPSIERETGLPGEVLGDRLAHVPEPGVRHVAVLPRLGIPHQVDDGPPELLGRIEVRIAERQVADVLGPELGDHLPSTLEHGADPRGTREITRDAAGYGHGQLPVK